jgi:hypothetical protein
MAVVLIVLVGAVGGIIVAGALCYRRLALPRMLPLSEQDLELCRHIVGRGEGLPWVCRRALKSGMCPCQPCERLERERRRERELYLTLESWR